MVAVRAAVASASAAARDRGGVPSGSCALLRSLRRSRSLWRLLCGPCSPRQRRGGAAGAVGGGGPTSPSRDASPAISPAVSPALRRSGGRSERGAAWQSYRQPSLTPPSSFDGGQAGGEHGGGLIRAVSISELQRSSHDSDGESHYSGHHYSGAGGSPLVQVLYSTHLTRTSVYHSTLTLTLTLTNPNPNPNPNPITLTLYT